MGFWAYVLCLLSLLGLAVAWAKALIFLSSPCFPFLHLWASWLLILPYHFIMPAIALHFLYFVLPCGLVGWCSCRASPLLDQSFAQGFLGLLFTSLLLLGFVGQHSYCANPFHYFIPQASLTRLLPFYLFYSHGLLARSFELLRPNYHIFTSYYFLALLAFKSAQWVY